MDEITNEDIGEGKKPDMRSLIFVDDVMIWGNKKKKNIERRLKCRKTVAEKYVLKINIKKMAVLKISRNKNDDGNIKQSGINL